MSNHASKLWQESCNRFNHSTPVSKMSLSATKLPIVCDESVMSPKVRFTSSKTAKLLSRMKCRATHNTFAIAYFRNRSNSRNCYWTKAHGTTATAVQSNLRWKCDTATADRYDSIWTGLLMTNRSRHWLSHIFQFPAESAATIATMLSIRATGKPHHFYKR